MSDTSSKQRSVNGARGKHASAKESRLWSFFSMAREIGNDMSIFENIDSLLNDNKRLEAELFKKNEENKQLKHECNIANVNLEQAKLAHKNGKSDMLSGFEDRYEEHLQKVTELTASAEMAHGLGQELEKLKGEKRSMHQELKTLRTSLQQADAQNKDVEGRLEKAESNCNNYRRQVQVLILERDDFKGKLDEAKKRLGEEDLPVIKKARIVEM